MEKLKLRLGAERSVGVRGLSQIFTTHLSLQFVNRFVDVVGCSGVSFCDFLFFVLLPIAIFA